MIEFDPPVLRVAIVVLTLEILFIYSHHPRSHGSLKYKSGSSFLHHGTFLPFVLILHVEGLETLLTFFSSRSFQGLSCLPFAFSSSCLSNTTPL